jgi:1,4-dihydroxy-2-naphthoyl-CoA hydrolase
MDDVLGFEVLATGDGSARGGFEVTDRVRQPAGLVHGGAYATLAESLASVATQAAVGGEGKVVLGQSNHTSFLRPVTSGRVHAEAVPRHRGETVWVWEVELSDDRGRLCAVSRVTLAVRRREDAP